MATVVRTQTRVRDTRSTPTARPSGQSPPAVEPRAAIADRILQRTTLDAYTEVFRALSEPTRIEILSLIASCEDEYPCTRLEAVLPVTKSTISYHIKILSRAGLIQVRRAGRYYHYRVRRNVVEYFLPGFLDHLEREVSS